MSQASFLKFLQAVRGNPAMLAVYNQRNLSQLLFHARNKGFDFTEDEVAEVAGQLEANVILSKDHDTFNESSRLWREMWGRYRLEYLINHVVSRHTDEELQSLTQQWEQESI
jgi:Nif11 domain